MAGRNAKNNELLLHIVRSIITNYTITVTEMAVVAAVTKGAVIYAVKKIIDKVEKRHAISGLSDQEMLQLQDALALRSRADVEAKEQKCKIKEEKRLQEEQEKIERCKIRDREIDMDIFLRKQAKKMPNRLQISSAAMIQWNLQNYDADGKLNFRHYSDGKLLMPCSVPKGLPKRFPKCEFAAIPSSCSDSTAPPAKASTTAAGRRAMAKSAMN